MCEQICSEDVEIVITAGTNVTESKESSEQQQRTKWARLPGVTRPRCALGLPDEGDDSARLSLAALGSRAVEIHVLA